MEEQRWRSRIKTSDVPVLMLHALGRFLISAVFGSSFSLECNFTRGCFVRSHAKGSVMSA